MTIRKVTSALLPPRVVTIVEVPNQAEALSSVQAQLRCLSLYKPTQAIAPSPGVFFGVRYAHTRAHNDRQHVTESGQIKGELIEKRKRFLIRNAEIFEDKTIYANSHLFDPHKMDDDGETNLERMKSGRCPLDDEGDFVTLHHLDQSHGSDLVAMTNKFHQDNHQALHSQVTLADGVRRGPFQREKQQYWKSVYDRSSANRIKYK